MRQAQHAPDLEAVYDECASFKPDGSWEDPAYQTSQEVYDDSVPSWFVGLAIHVLLAAGALAWAWRRSEVPARRLPTGSRIA